MLIKSPCQNFSSLVHLVPLNTAKSWSRWSRGSLTINKPKLYSVERSIFLFFFFHYYSLKFQKTQFDPNATTNLPNVVCTLQLCLLVKLVVLFIIYIHHFLHSFWSRSAKYIQIHSYAASQNIPVSKTVDIFLYPHMCVCRFFFMDPRKMAKKNSICKNVNVQAYTHITKGCMKVF